MPVWLVAHLDHLMQGSGRWRALDSAAPAGEGYEQRWSWTLGRTGLRGELVFSGEGVELPPIWQYSVTWDPVDAVARLTMHGGDGTLGVGELHEDRLRAELVLRAPDGSTRIVADEHEPPDAACFRTRSFEEVDGRWHEITSHEWRLSE